MTSLCTVQKAVGPISNGIQRCVGMPLPRAVEYRFETIPAELKHRTCWMPFRFCSLPNWAPGERAWTKVPVDVRSGGPGRVNDPATWATYDEALEYFIAHQMDENPRTVAHGLGIALVEPYSACDLDHHLEDGEADQFAAHVLASLDTYCEISVSGDGLHALGRARISVPSFRSAENGLEVFGGGHYLTMTGRVLNGFNRIQYRQEQFEAVLRQFRPCKLEPWTDGQKSSCIHRRGEGDLRDAPVQTDADSPFQRHRPDEQVLARIKRVGLDEEPGVRVPPSACFVRATQARPPLFAAHDRGDAAARSATGHYACRSGRTDGHQP